MIIVRAIALLLHFTIIPVALGRLITYRASEEQHKSPVVVYTIGLFSSYAIFFVLMAILEWFQNWHTFNEPFTGCFTALCIIYSVLMAILIIVELFVHKFSFKKILEYVKGKSGIIVAGCKKDRFALIYGLIFFAILLVQLYFSYGYEVNEWSYDDYDYVVSSQDTLTYDMISNVNFISGEPQYTTVKRAATAWPTYIAYLARATGFEVTTICHTIFPVLFLLIAYGIYYYMSGLIFSEIENRFIFMILLSIAFAFGMHSHYSLTFRLLCTIWQGKAVLSAVAIPFYLVYMIQLYRAEIKTANMLPIFMLSLGMCSLTVMSMPLVSLTTVLLWLLMSIYKRKPYGIRYLLAGLFGPILQMIFYGLIWLLLEDMKSDDSTIFHRWRGDMWWYKWFG